MPHSVSFFVLLESSMSVKGTVSFVDDVPLGRLSRLVDAILVRFHKGPLFIAFFLTLQCICRHHCRQQDLYIYSSVTARLFLDSSYTTTKQYKHMLLFLRTYASQSALCKVSPLSKVFCYSQPGVSLDRYLCHLISSLFARQVY